MAHNRPKNDDGKLMTDTEIAEVLGVSKSLVWYARHRFNAEASRGI